MIMKGYSQDLENVARARAEGVEASYKDLSQVCGMIARQDTEIIIAPEIKHEGKLFQQAQKVGMGKK
jgi:hypothetical protein